MADIALLLGSHKLELENFEHKPFIPFNKLEALFTRDKIYELLQQHNIEFYLIEEIVDRVLDGGLRMFAILAAIQEIGSITRFIKGDQFFKVSLDAKLPLTETDISLYLSNLDKRESFFRKQWTFMAPVFSKDQSRRELHDRIVLPFLRRTYVSQGGHAKVYRVTVDASHHRLSTTTESSGLAMFGSTQQQSVSTLPLDLICKELESSDDEETLAKKFDHEISILSALRCLQHPNIISLIASFSKGTTYSFLFPVAEMDLQKLLNTSKRLSGFQTETEIFGSLWGLSSALEAVHNYFFPRLEVQQIGCHYDIKPNNILFSNGKLILSDFGISRLRETEDGSQTTFKKGEGYYMAPECESITEGFKRGRIGRASDVWSLGCVLADILVYLSVEPAKGPEAIRNFIEDRKLKVGSYVFRMFFGENEVNPGVQKLLKRSKADPALSHGLRLLATIVDKALQFDPAQRPLAADLTRLLFHLTQQTRVSAMIPTFDSNANALDLELEIEMERLSIWNETVGLHADPLNVPESTWFAVNHSFEEYERLQLLLIKLEAEIGTIAIELQKLGFGRPAFRLYYRLQKLQDQLWDGQPLMVRRQMFDRLEETMLSKETLSRSQMALESICSTNEDSFSSERFRRRLAYLATMKNVASALVRQDRQKHDYELNKEVIKGPLSDLGPHAVGVFEPKREHVLVEFLNYEEEWSSRENELLERVNAIASLRNRGVAESIFPILQCCGYYHEPARTRFGIVYQLPTEAQNTVPISLLTVLEKTKSRALQPSLTQRFKLASALVSYVLSFHRGAWLHRSISALNIICFPETFPSIAASIARPYFIGFNHSRANDDNKYSSQTEMEYQHPAYQANTQAYADDMENGIVRFRQEFDYYSVGLVLMEIALWKSLTSMTGDSIGSPEEMLSKLRKKYIPQVRICMGDVYSNAVLYCLGDYEKGERSHENVRNDFNANVVLPISRCSVYI